MRILCHEACKRLIMHKRTKTYKLVLLLWEMLALCLQFGMYSQFFLILFKIFFFFFFPSLLVISLILKTIYDAFNVPENWNENGEAENNAETRTDLLRLSEFDVVSIYFNFFVSLFLCLFLLTFVRLFKEPGTWVDVDNTDTSSDSIYARQKKEEISILKVSKNIILFYLLSSLCAIINSFF